MEVHHGQRGDHEAPREALSPWRAASALALLALALPVVVLLVVLVDSLGPWRAQQMARIQRQAAAATLDALATSPSGRPPRQGPAPHPAISRAHSPALSRPGGAP